jgi:hypothetical protein
MKFKSVIKAFLVFALAALAACEHDDRYADRTFKKIHDTAQSGG